MKLRGYLFLWLTLIFLAPQSSLAGKRVLTRMECGRLIELSAQYAELLLAAKQLNLSPTASSEEKRRMLRSLTDFPAGDLLFLGETGGDELVRLFDEALMDSATDLGSASGAGLTFDASIDGFARINIESVPRESGLASFLNRSKAMGVSLSYSPTMLRAWNARGLYDRSENISYLSHPAFRNFSVTHIELHEQGHGYLEYLGSLGYVTPFDLHLSRADHSQLCPDYRFPIPLTKDQEKNCIAGYGHKFNTSELYTFAITLSALGAELSALDRNHADAKHLRLWVLDQIESSAAAYHQMAFQTEALTKSFLDAMEASNGKSVSSGLHRLPEGRRAVSYDWDGFALAYPIFSEPEERAYDVLVDQSSVAQERSIAGASLSHFTEVQARSQNVVGREVMPRALSIGTLAGRYLEGDRKESWDFGELVEECHAALRAVNLRLPKLKPGIVKPLQPGEIPTIPSP